MQSALDDLADSPTPTTPIPTSVDRALDEPVPAATEQDDGAPGSTSDFESPAAEPDPEGVRLTVTASWILDGDSFEATGPDGRLEIRLLGINANESSECLGNEARDRLIALIGREEVDLELDGYDEFGREIAYVFHDGVLINELLVAEGLAVARSPFGHRLEENFDDAEEAAAEAGLGMWAADACGPPDMSGVFIASVNFDAEGPDNENPNGEWILLENGGLDPVPLGGWIVRDESTRHRYIFDESVVLEPGASVRIRSGCGTDGAASATELELFWCPGQGTVWSNSGDTALVYNSSGAVVDTVSWDSIYDD